MKVICAGFSRTGTKTMSQALRVLDYTNVHDFFEHYAIDGKYWEKIFACKGTIDDFKEMYKDVDAVADIPANIYWEEILKAFPDAKVILTMRDNEDQWYKSFSNYMRFVGENFFFERHRTLGTLFYKLTPTGAGYLQYCKDACTVGYGYFPSWIKTNEIVLRNCYRRHNRNVLNGCPPDRLLVYNVKQGWGPLCKFLGKKEPDVPFPIENRPSDAFMLKFAKGTYPYDGGLRDRIKSELTSNLLKVFFALGLTVALIFVSCFAT